MLKKPLKDLRWNLDDVLPVSKFDSFRNEIEDDINKLLALFDEINEESSEADFKRFVDFDEALTEKLARLYDLPSLMETTDEKSAKAKLLKEKAKEVYVQATEKTRKISHWLKGLPIDGKKQLDDKNASRLFSAIPDLQYVYSYSRESAKHTLSEKEESILTQKSAYGESVLEDLRSIIETEFEYKFHPKGTKSAKIIKTQSELVNFTHSEKASERKAAYEALFTKHKEHLDKFFLIYQAVVKNWVYEAKLRGFVSPISVRNFKNHIPDKAVETMLKVSRDNKHVFQKYFKFKAKELGLKRLSRFDLYAPLGKADSKVPFSKALNLVLDTFKDFSTGFEKRARLIIDSRHIDSHARPGKRSGAFCSTISPNITPYVLMNYAGRVRDVATLAHELGHGIHSLYANKHSISSQHANLPLAETASTLGELILFEKLLALEKNPKNRKAMLAEKIGDSYATILRQNYFIQLEIDAHDKIPKGITAEELSDIWLSGLKDQFGPAVEVPTIFKYEWAYIPHIVHTPFYCYAYNFGELLSLALFKRYKENGNSFVPKIERILEYGGSENPDKILKEIGVDMASPAFWQEGFEVIKEWQKQLEEIKQKPSQKLL